MSTAKGIETIKHLSPSTIGVDTLYNSGGKIPDVFLRGCGVPENLITYLPSLLTGPAPIQFYSCFISYSHEDKKFARRIHDTLQGRGIRCWLDEKQIRPGDHIHDAVDRGIRLWDKVILCASKDSLNSWWVEKELSKAFAKEADIQKKEKRRVHAIIPLALDRYIFDSWIHSLKDDVLTRSVADFTGWESDNAKFESEFEKVEKALRADEGAREKPPKPKL